MRKLMKIISIIVGILVLIGAVLALLLPQLLDPNDYKDRIREQVNARTGHTLTIDGDIKLAVFPWLALELGPVQLSNAPGFGTAPFAQAQHTLVRVKLIPLLSKQVQVDKITLDGLRVNLARDARGRANWQGLLAPAAPDNTKAASGTDTAAAPAVAMLEIGAVDLRDAQLVWDDRQAGSRYTLSAINLHTGRFTPGKPFAVSLAAAVVAGVAPAPAYKFQLDSTVTADIATQQYQLRKTRLELGLPQGGAVTLSSDLELDLAKQSLVMPAIAFDAHGLKVTGKLQGSKIIDQPALTGELQLAEFSPRDLLKALDIGVPAGADPAVLNKASARVSLQAGRDRITFKPLSLTLDDSTARGELSVSDFAERKFAFKLEIDDINVDRYLPPPPPEDKAAPAAAAVAPAAPWPVAALRALNLDGSLQIGRLQAYRLRSTDVRLTVKAQGGVLRVQPASAQLYDGSYQGDVELDARTATPRVALNEKLQGIQIGALLQDLQGESARLSGKGDLSARLHGAGADAVALRRNLNGAVQFGFKDGAVRGFNLAAKIRKAKAALKGQAVPADSSSDQTDFSELTGTATITNGVVRSDDLQGKSPYMRVSGVGQADLGDQSMDYLLKVLLVKTGAGQSGAGMEELNGVTVPVRISGPFAQLSYRVDFNAAVGEVAKARLEEKKEEVTQKLQDQLQNKLKGLFR